MDRSAELREQVTAATAPLQIRGSGSKDFLGRQPQGEVFSLAGHSGILHYDPRELVITARAGTPLAEIEQTLAQSGQMLPFEPPHFGESATLGGSIACNLSGPRRPYAGAARDFVLGVRLLNGQGEILRFGGEVMKNVAGYDLARFMAGAYGTLGVLLEISLKVLPRPAASLTLTQECAAVTAIETMNRRASQALPLSAACYNDGLLRLRLEGAESALEEARHRLGGEAGSGAEFWHSLREHRLEFFTPGQTLWRLAVPPATPPLDVPGDWLLDWGGGLRWLHSHAPAALIRQAAQAVGGHAMQFRGGDRDGEIFHPLPASLLALHRRLKQAFDPKGIFNPGRMYDF